MRTALTIAAVVWAVTSVAAFAMFAASSIEGRRLRHERETREVFDAEHALNLARVIASAVDADELHDLRYGGWVGISPYNNQQKLGHQP